jgi:hypothetical protein
MKLATRKDLKVPYRIYDDCDKEVGHFRTEKQARDFARKEAKKKIPVENSPGYNSFLVTHLYWDKDVEMVYEDEIISYSYRGK